MDLALHGGSDVIKLANVVRDLGVIRDQELFMKQHINKVTSNRFFQASPSYTRSQNHNLSQPFLRHKPSGLL